MLYTTLHNRILRLVLAVLGELIAAAALNLFIVPLSLYTGGLLGFCQLVRTLLQDFLSGRAGSSSGQLGINIQSALEVSLLGQDFRHGAGTQGKRRDRPRLRQRTFPPVLCSRGSDLSVCRRHPGTGRHGHLGGKHILVLRVRILGPHDGKIGQGPAARQIAALGFLHEGPQAPFEDLVQVQRTT